MALINHVPHTFHAVTVTTLQHTPLQEMSYSIYFLLNKIVISNIAHSVLFYKTIYCKTGIWLYQYEIICEMRAPETVLLLLHH